MFREAIKLFRKKRIDHLVYIATIKTAEKTYWSFFRTGLEAFSQFKESADTDTLVGTVLNGEPVFVTPIPDYLFFATQHNFQVLNEMDTTGVSANQKRYIIVLTSKHPKRFINASK
ncbi:MAG: hypothetical protein WDO71_00250 [Bacteroidota bacterium]